MNWAWPKKIFFLGLIVAYLISFIANAAWSQDLSNQVDQIISKYSKDASLGVMIQNIADGETLYAYRAHDFFIPGSTAKLFTSMAAWEVLGENFKYQTHVLLNERALSAGAVQGDVEIVFSGDPSLSYVRFAKLLANLSKANIEKITGDIWINAALFSGPLTALGCTKDSLPWYHAAPISAVIIDENKFAVALYPPDKLGGIFRIKVPDTPSKLFIKVQSNLSAVTLEESERLCQIEIKNKHKNDYYVNGCWPMSRDIVSLNLSLRNPSNYIQQVILLLLEQQGIILQGSIKFGSSPEKLPIFASSDSEPLYKLLAKVLSDSNNIYSDSLLKVIGMQKFGRGTFQAGSLAVEKILSSKMGLDFARVALFDGSGSSRYNLVTPSELVNLLYSAAKIPALGNLLKEQLAQAGSKGTLKYRLTNLDPKARMWAKTGSLKGVSTLAGYIKTSSDQHLIVAIMSNNFIVSNMNKFEDELCCLLANKI